MKAIVLCFILLSPLASSIADEQVRSTQEELRRRNIYFGDVDGRRSRELEEALKRYQKRKGISTTGRDDRDTLRSLGIVRREPGEELPRELEWPAEPVLKSDSKLDIGEAAQEIAAKTGVAPASVAAVPATSGTRTVRSDVKTAPLTATAPPQTSARIGAPSQTVPFSPINQKVLPNQLAEYVRDYVKAIGRNRIDEEMPFYADRVNYLGNGWVDRRILEHSLSKYYQRWPKRSYKPIGPISYRSIPSRGEIVVSFRMEFSLANREGRVRGQTDNQIVINAATVDPRIVSVTERRVRQ